MAQYLVYLVPLVVCAAAALLAYRPARAGRYLPGWGLVLLGLAGFLMLRLSARGQQGWDAIGSAIFMVGLALPVVIGALAGMALGWGRRR